MERIRTVREFVDGVPSGLEEAAGKHVYAHLCEVAQYAALLALRRGEDPELAAVAGLLHDIYTYQAGEAADHAHRGAVLAGEILRGLGLFSPEEVELVTHAIFRHSDKGAVEKPFDELLKDADVLSHGLENPLEKPPAHEEERWNRLREELGMAGDCRQNF